MQSKIQSISEAKTGMGHLIEQAHPKTQPKEVIPDFPEGKCLKMRCILEGVDYYIPNGEALFANEPPYFPFCFPVGYSVVVVMESGSKSAPLAVIKHLEKRFFQTGISTEIVDLPAWWDRRDSY